MRTITPAPATPYILDTLAQPIPLRAQQGFQPAAPKAKGRGEGKGKPPVGKLMKKAKGCHFSKELARHLSQLDSPLNKAYRRTQHDCCRLMVQENKKLQSRYCNARWCNTCNRIRTAKLMKGYREAIASLQDARHVVLTVVNVPGHELKAKIDGMIQDFINIQRAAKRAGKPLKGIRKIECTYNVDRDDYHPHFHLIIEGEANADWLIREWLRRNPTARRECQKSIPVDAGAAMELFKYVTKLVTSSKGDEAHGFKIYVPALDTIFQAMHRRRTFQSFGGIKCVDEEIDDVAAEDIEELPPYEFAVWQWVGSDWINMADGTPLSGYKPSEAMKKLLTECMVT